MKSSREGGEPTEEKLGGCGKTSGEYCIGTGNSYCTVAIVIEKRTYRSMVNNKQIIKKEKRMTITQSSQME